MSEIETRVKEIIARHLETDQDRITNDANFIDDLGADSLDQVELIMELEKEFSCEIPDDVAEKIVKVEDAIKYIEEHAQAA